ncbi:hypothetical protein Droror1_Dr00027757, partial [Drosera rotundifolia]
CARSWRAFPFQILNGFAQQLPLALWPCSLDFLAQHGSILLRFQRIIQMILKQSSPQYCTIHCVGMYMELTYFSLSKVTLSEVKFSLRPHGPKEDSPLKIPVAEANWYAEDAVKRFLEAGRATLRAGADESAIVTMRPSLTSPGTGSGYSSYH